MSDGDGGPAASGLCVSLIAAIAQNGAIGRNNDLPWSLRDDMRFFVETTRGRTVVTGRKNFEAMGRPLPGRRNIVVTRKPAAFGDAGGVECVSSVEQALRLAQSAREREVFVIGGAQIYAEALPYAHCFYRTRVLANVEGDVYFPAFSADGWRIEPLFRREADARNQHPFVVEKLTRASSPRSFTVG